MQSEMLTDVLIVGAGLVGASLAVAMGGASLRVALVEAKPPVAAAPADWDSRIYAISPANRAFLDTIGVWGRLDPARMASVQQMTVFGDRRSRIEFSAYEAGVESLAWIVESGALARALWSVMERQPNLTLVCPAIPERLELSESAARLSLDSGRSVDARLVVGADGAQSFVRDQASIRADRKPYGQLGVVANFYCERPHRGTAFQWFRQDGVLAWLPLPENRISMVWSTSEAHAQELLVMPPDALCQCVADAGANTLGQLKLITAPAAFPLARMTVSSMVAQRVALIGDAAHVVHPLAGQGVNLGFGDAAELAKVLLSVRPGRDVGDRLLLRRFERARAEDILAMRWATHGLERLFLAGKPGLGAVRNLGLNFVDRMQVLKMLLVKHALG